VSSATSSNVSASKNDGLRALISCISFGTVAMALNIVPVVSVIFSLTTSVGAALWASDIETKAGGGSASEVEVSLGDDWGKKEVGGKKEL
jgi:hypothetical protein